MRRIIRAVVALLGLGMGWAAAGTPAAPGPKDAAMAVFRILQKQDWVALHGVVAFSEKVTDDLGSTTPEAFAAGVRHGIGQNQDTMDRLFNGMSELAVGEPEVRGDYATLPTSCVITVQGQRHPFQGSIRLIRRQHTWRWDLSFTDNAEEATSKALGDLLGKPTAGAGGR
jgi:hypothetical protein